MLTNVRVLRSLFLLAFSGLFIWQSFDLPLGTLSRAGPGLFPLLVSSILAIIAAVLLVEALLKPHEDIVFNLRSISLVTTALVGFAILAHWSVVPAIIFLVFVASIAGTNYSVMRNVKLSAALILIAVLFRYGLGVNLTFF